MDQPAFHRRGVTCSRFGDNARINQGDIHYHLPHPAAHAEVVRVIPYPRNEDLVHRRHFIDRLDKLLPPTPGSRSAALWGLGGSGKTQIALDYAYRRCDADEECSVFWVHADSETTFLADYKTIGKKLGVDEQLDGTDLLDAVRNEIERRPKWLLVLDNADNLRLFGVGRQFKGEGSNENQNLYRYVPCTSQGTVLWTSRDARIAGTLVGSRRGIEVRSMVIDEATTLLAVARDEPSTLREASVDALLEELRCLPLAISQGGVYMRRMSMSAEKYLDLLRQGKTRWEVLRMSGTDRHRRPEVSNSVLETWRISTERIRAESEMSYGILHVIAYLDSQDITQELMAAAASRYNIGGERSTGEATELEVLEAVTRLTEFSFLGLRRKEDSRRSYEMHKLVQEAVRFGLRISSSVETTTGKAPGAVNEPENSEAYYSGIALQIVDDLFPPSQPTSWAQCEEYVTHAVRVGEWAEGRYDEAQSICREVLEMRREVLGEKHPNTIRSMADLATTYHQQGRYAEAENICQEVLEMRRGVLRGKHPDTISSMADLAATYHQQGRYDEAFQLHQTAFHLRCLVLGENHPDTMQSVAYLASTREALQQLPYLIEPAQSLAVTQVHESEEGKLRDRSLREVMRGKVGRFRKWGSHKSWGFD
uniref:DUF7779 domain-containing protein n=1 Tax=Fusarium oxysporum (strain Fo5176) TaxID=660025 RepID=A0A0D2YIK3_FUSOF